jgi:hypothetical protein
MQAQFFLPNPAWGAGKPNRGGNFEKRSGQRISFFEK